MTSRIPTDMVADRTSKAKLSDTLGSIQTSINTNTSSLADMGSISAFNNDLVNALNNSNKVYIPAGKTITVSQTLSNLNGKKIVGSGTEVSTIKFVGNIDCFLLTNACHNFELSDVTILVDPTNYQAVIKLVCYNGDIKGNRFKNIRISTSDNATQGNYTGVLLYTDTDYITGGTFQNIFEKISIYKCDTGIRLHCYTKTTRQYLAWITMNTFISPYVESYLSYGIDIFEDSQDGGTLKSQISDNTFLNPQLDDFLNNPTTDRTGIRLGGAFNSFIAPNVFNDSNAHVHYTLEMVTDLTRQLGGVNNSIIGGHLEGRIKNPQNKNVNTINTNWVSRDNNTQNADYIGDFKNENINILPNSDFSKGLLNWTNVSYDSASIVTDASADFGKSLQLTKATANFNYIKQSMVNRANLAGRYMTFAVKIKANAANTTIQLTIDEGVQGKTDKQYVVGTAYQVIYVDRLINGSGDAFNCNITIPSGSNITLNVAWTMLCDGYTRTQYYKRDTPWSKRNFIGQTTVTSASTTANGDTGQYEYVIPLERLNIKPITSLGTATKWWITTNASTGLFTINLDQSPGANVTFAWNIDF